MGFFSHHKPSPKTVSEPGLTPRHVAFIMDGNGRWAAKRGLPRNYGHTRGIDSLRAVVAACVEREIAYATFYAFSTENWRRPAKEVNHLMDLFIQRVPSLSQEMKESGVCLRFPGLKEGLSSSVLSCIRDAEQHTAGGRFNVQVAFNYGGRAEIVHAVARLLDKVKSGSIPPSAITEQDVAGELFFAGIPDPDILIRTGGEKRLSNFLLWQSAYSELFFTKTLWPDFGARELDTILSEYSHRERRFGGVVR